MKHLQIGQTRSCNTRTMLYICYGLILPVILATQCVTQPDNKPPTAVFSVTPESGLVETQFLFDAGESNDPEEESRYLQVRWEWEGDGVWDTLWSSKKERLHGYGRTGTFKVTLEVRDSWGSTDSFSRDIIISDSPNPVISISDANGLPF